MRGRKVGGVTARPPMRMEEGEAQRQWGGFNRVGVQRTVGRGARLVPEDSGVCMSYIL